MTKASYTYDPWGKPGAGAPISRMEHKKKKFTEYDGFKVSVRVKILLNYSLFDFGISHRSSLMLNLVIQIVAKATNR